MTRRVKISALSVTCPQCGAHVDERCWSGTRRGQQLTRGAHASRKRRARGEDVPDDFGVWLRGQLRLVQEDVLSQKKP